MATDAERKAAAKAAFDKRQARIRKDKGVTVVQRDAQKKDTIERARIVTNLGLAVGSALPLGAVIRGGILVFRGLTGAKAMSALKKATEAKKLLTTGKKVNTPKTTPNSVKAPRKPIKAERKPIKAERKPLKPKSVIKAKPLKKSTPKSSGLTAAQKLAIAGGVAATAGATKLSNTNAKPTGKVATKRKATGMADRKTSKPASQTSKRKPTGMGDRKTSKPTVEASKRKATGMGDRKARKPVEKKRTTRTDKEIAAKMLTRKETEKRPSPRSFSPDKAKEGAATKRTNISASKNTGFGPKGNIFPSNAADRKRLMAKFGGTGSAAAKAAARGTQGNLKKGKK